MRVYKEGTKVENDEIYILDPASIKVGDIILSTGPFSPDSEFIKIMTGGEYSHAAICTDVGMVVEANISTKKDPGAVQRSSIMRIATTDPRHVRVLRLRQTISNREEIAKNAAGYAEFMISRQYWWDAVQQFLSSNTPPNARGQFFCSHLVADAYRHAGIELLPNTLAAKTAPGDFIASKLLQDITTQALRIEKESIVRSYLPAPEENIHLNIEIKLQQELLSDPKLHAIVRRLHSPLPRSYFDELLPLLCTTKDRELDELIAATEEEMAKQAKAAIPQYALNQDHVTLLRDALQSKALSDAQVQGELNLLRYQKHIVDADITKRQKDVKENSVLFNKSKLKTFYRRWNTSLNYLRFMEGQKRLLDEQISLLTS